MVKNEKMTQKNYPTQGQDLDETFFFNFSVLSVTFFTKGIFFQRGWLQAKKMRVYSSAASARPPAIKY